MNRFCERTVGIRDPTAWSLFEHDVTFPAVYAPSIDLAGVAHPGFGFPTRSRAHTSGA